MRSKTCSVIGLIFSIVLHASFVLGQTVSEDQAGTERQKAFGRAYDEMYPSSDGRKLRDIKIPGMPVSDYGHIGTSVGIPSMPTFGDMKRYEAGFVLQRLMCKSDVVVRGNALASKVYLTEAESFTFTEYAFEITHVLFGSLKTNVIAVSRPGGKVKIGNLTVSAEDKSFQQLEEGSEYILFLKYLAPARGYLVTDAQSDFRIQGSSFFSIAPVGVPRELKDGPTNALIQRIRSAAEAGCTSETKP